VAEDKPKRRLKSSASNKKSDNSKKVTKKQPRKLKKSDAKKQSQKTSRLKSLREKHIYIPLPDNKAGKFLNKPRKVHIVPKFLSEAWEQLKLVRWPNAREVIGLTFAVIIFAILFGGFIGLSDYFLEIIFRRIIL
jgi:preprotein translocase SecE subunit